MALGRWKKTCSNSAAAGEWIKFRGKEWSNFAKGKRRGLVVSCNVLRIVKSTRFLAHTSSTCIFILS